MHAQPGFFRRLAHRATAFSMRRGRLVTATMVGSTVALVLAALLPTLWPSAFPSLSGIQVDTDPENMLPPDEPSRLMFHHVKDEFGIHDGVVLGIVNEQEPDGVFNPDTLGRIFTLSRFVKTLDGVVASEVLSLSTVDDIANDGEGVLKFQWLMPEPPPTQQAADHIRERAMRSPFLYDSLVSADGKTAIVFVPLEAKHYAHDVAAAIQQKIDEIGHGSDEIHFAGLPVAEEVFGVEMFKQMAISAPVAMVVIFLLMWFFFKRISLIIAPMVVAMVAALSTMGLLVLTGNTIHIMSSMIPIFIMPIAVLDSIHIISDFFEKYQKSGDRKAAVMEVMDELSMPMLFTSLTTAVGFASLALTPIPPVQTFGLFVAFGVLLCWLWTVTFVPAYIGMMSEKRLAGFGRPATEVDHESGFFQLLDRVTYNRARLVLLLTVALAGTAAYGISKIEINDNPTRWFEADHPIRIADAALNKHFGGTYDVYLTVRAPEQDYSPAHLSEALNRRLAREGEQVGSVLGEVAKQIPVLGADAADAEGVLDALDEWVRGQKRTATEAAVRGWMAATEFVDVQFRLADESVGDLPDPAEFRSQLSQRLGQFSAQTAAAFAGAPQRLERVESAAPASEAAFLEGLRFEPNSAAERVLMASISASAQRGEVFKDPEVLAWLEKLDLDLHEMTGVGKVNSLATLVKTVHRDLISGTEADFRIPARNAMVAQTLEQFTMSHRKDDLWHFVTPDYRNTVLWIQLQSADNQVMEALQADLRVWNAENPPPDGIDAPQWSGLTYINAIWQDKMVTGMLDAFLGSFIIVLIMMMVLFRSVLWGILAMIPLTVTVGVTYGILGFIGKSYDMPVAVLSSLSLGLAVDYAIHFVARSRELEAAHGSWVAARDAVFAEPARAIGRNVIVLGVGFLPLLLAPLVPYQTVGVLIAALLLLAGLGTLVILPAMIAVLSRWLFRGPGLTPGGLTSGSLASAAAEASAAPPAATA